LTGIDLHLSIKYESTLSIIYNSTFWFIPYISVDHLTIPGDTYNSVYRNDGYRCMSLWLHVAEYGNRHCYTLKSVYATHSTLKSVPPLPRKQQTTVRCNGYQTL
jgi:hypothetical protein